MTNTHNSEFHLDRCGVCNFPTWTFDLKTPTVCSTCAMIATDTNYPDGSKPTLSNRDNPNLTVAIIKERYAALLV